MSTVSNSCLIGLLKKCQYFYHKWLQQLTLTITQQLIVEAVPLAWVLAAAGRVIRDFLSTTNNLNVKYYMWTSRVHSQVKVYIRHLLMWNYHPAELPPPPRGRTLFILSFMTAHFCGWLLGGGNTYRTLFNLVMKGSNIYFSFFFLHTLRGSEQRL